MLSGHDMSDPEASISALTSLENSLLTATLKAWMAPTSVLWQQDGFSGDCDLTNLRLIQLPHKVVLQYHHFWWNTWWVHCALRQIKPPNTSINGGSFNICLLSFWWINFNFTTWHALLLADNYTILWPLIDYFTSCGKTKELSAGLIKQE